MGLDAQGTKRHGTRYKVLHDRLHRLHLVNRSRLGSLLEAKEVADKDRFLTTVDDGSPLLEFLVITLTCGQL